MNVIDYIYNHFQISESDIILWFLLEMQWIVECVDRKITTIKLKGVVNKDALLMLKYFLQQFVLLLHMDVICVPNSLWNCYRWPCREEFSIWANPCIRIWVSLTDEIVRGIQGLRDKVTPCLTNRLRLTERYVIIAISGDDFFICRKITLYFIDKYHVGEFQHNEYAKWPSEHVYR